MLGPPKGFPKWARFDAICKIIELIKGGDFDEILLRIYGTVAIQCGEIQKSGAIHNQLSQAKYGWPN